MGWEGPRDEEGMRENRARRQLPLFGSSRLVIQPLVGHRHGWGSPWKESRGAERLLLLLGMAIVHELGWEQEGWVLLGIQQQRHLFELQ